MGIITITQDGEIYSEWWPASPGQVGAKGLAVGGQILTTSRLPESWLSSMFKEYVYVCLREPKMWRKET